MNMPNHFHQGDRQLGEPESYPLDTAPLESAGSRTTARLKAGERLTASKRPLLIDQKTPGNFSASHISVWLWAAFAIASGAFSHTDSAQAASANRTNAARDSVQQSWTQILGEAWDASDSVTTSSEAPASTMRASGTARAMGAALSRSGTIFTAWPTEKAGKAARQTATSPNQSGFVPALWNAAANPLRAIFTPAVLNSAQDSSRRVSTSSAPAQTWNQHSVNSGFLFASFHKMAQRTLLAQSEEAKSGKAATKSSSKAAPKTSAPKASAVSSTRPQTSTARTSVQTVTSGSAATLGASRVKVSSPNDKSWILKVATQGTTVPGGTMMSSGSGLLPPASVNAKVASPVTGAPSLLPSTPQILAQVSANDPVSQLGKAPWRDAQGRPMRKVITVSSLKQLPPASQPLPAWTKGKTMSADPILPSMPNMDGSRLAQGPVPSLRQPARPVTNSDRLPNQLEVAVGTFVVLLTTTDLDTVAVAEPSIADVAVVNSRAVLVNGKAPGITSLVIVDRQRIRQYQVRVVPAPGTLPRDIAAQIGLPGVGVRQVRDAIVLEGEVETAEEARRAVEIAGIYSPKVINQLTVRGVPDSPAALQTQIERAIGLPNVTVSVIGDTAILRGTVERSAQAAQAETVAGAFAKRVLNLIDQPLLTVEQVQDVLSGGQNVNEADSENGIRARQVGDQLVLEGTVADQARSEQAVAIAGRTGLQVVNRLQVLPIFTTESNFRRQLEQAINIPGIKVTGNEKTVVLTGVVENSNEAIRAVHIARAYTGRVENLIQTRNPIPVNIDVSIVEINRNDAKNLGVQLGTVALTAETVTPTQVLAPPAGSPPGTPNTIIPGNITRTIDPTFRPGVATAANGFAGGQSLRILDPFRVRIDALYSNGAARLLSNPNTTVNTGRLAEFQVGGQVPIPTVSQVGPAGATSGIVFKDFGILVSVMPTANPDGVVTLAIQTEVSQPDFANGVIPPGGGSAIPGFSRRSTTTEVTVPPNGTVALSGLIQNDITRTVSKIPVLSKIPILGSLFQSKRFQKNESELVIFVRPRVLPNPLSGGQTAPVTTSAGQRNEGTLGAGAPQADAAGTGAFNLEAPVGLNTAATANIVSGGGGGGNAQ